MSTRLFLDLMVSYACSNYWKANTTQSQATASPYWELICYDCSGFSLPGRYAALKTSPDVELKYSICNHHTPIVDHCGCDHSPYGIDRHLKRLLFLLLLKHLTCVCLKWVVSVLVSSGEHASSSLSVLELSLMCSQCKFASLRLV